MGKSIQTVICTILQCLQWILLPSQSHSPSFMLEIKHFIYFVPSFLISQCLGKIMALIMVWICALMVLWCCHCKKLWNVLMIIFVSILSKHRGASRFCPLRAPAHIITWLCNHRKWLKSNRVIQVIHTQNFSSFIDIMMVVIKSEYPLHRLILLFKGPVENCLYQAMIEHHDLNLFKSWIHKPNNKKEKWTAHYKGN